MSFVLYHQNNVFKIIPFVLFLRIFLRSASIEDPLGETLRYRLGRSNEVAIIFGWRSFKDLTMSDRTSGVAVAVSAKIGTVGNDVFNEPKLRTSGFNG